MAKEQDKATNSIFYPIYFIYICALQRPAGMSRGIAQPTCPLHAQWAVSGLSVNHEP